MKIRIVLAALLVMAALPAGPTAAAAEQPTLGARNTITAPRNGSIDVTLPRDVTLPLKSRGRAAPGPAPWISFEGTGRVLGVMLIPEGATSALSYGLITVQFRGCRRPTCSERPVNALMVNGKVFHGRETLRAGDYRLYVFGDGAPVKVRLELPTLTGVTEISVGQSTHVDVATPQAEVERHDDITTHWAGASYEMKTNQGLFMAVNVMRDENYRSEWFDECLSPDHETPDDIEKRQCVPMGGFTFLHGPSVVRLLQPRKGGFTLMTFVGLHGGNDNIFNGDSARHHYVFRVFSPGSMGELWSQGALLSF